MVTTRRFTLLAGLALVSRSHAAGIGFSAPNIVAITPQLMTSGQPSGPALESLGALGFQAVLYLAPSSVPDAVMTEPEILASQGIEFVHIPIPFSAPEPSHADAVSIALQRLKAKKVLVHCQVNMRASSMVFLHRVIYCKENPALAYEAVAKVWSPSGAWRTLLVHQLSKYKVSFEPY